MEWMIMPLRRYVDFSGRSRRKEYWLYTLFLLLVYIAFGILLAVGGGLAGLFDSSSLGSTAGMTTSFGILIIVFLIFILAILIPTIAVQVRRMHDQDKSGWWVLIAYIPVINYIGGIVLFVFMCIEGTKGENRFGPDPKGENIADVFA